MFYHHWQWHISVHASKLKSSPKPNGPWGGADLRFHIHSPQPDTSRSCKSTDTGLVCRVECVFSSQLAPVPIYTAWWTEAYVCEQLAQSCYVERNGRDLNLRPLGCKFDAITTTPTHYTAATLLNYSQAMHQQTALNQKWDRVWHHPAAAWSRQSIAVTLYARSHSMTNSLYLVQLTS